MQQAQRLASRASRVGAACLGERLVRANRRIRVERGLRLRDSLQDAGDDLLGGQASGAHARGHLGRGQVGNVIAVLQRDRDRSSSLCHRARHVPAPRCSTDDPMTVSRYTRAP
jgi:hypothetical protein